MNIEVPPQSFSLTVSLRGHQNGTTLSYSAKIATSGLEAQIKPSPRDLILKSYNMTLSCLPIAPLIHILNLSASVFIPELRGIITLFGQEKELSFDLKPIDKTILGTHVDAHFVDTDKAIFAMGGVVKS